MDKADLLDWSEPVKTIKNPDWIEYCVPHYYHVLRWCEGLRRDPLGTRDWASARQVLDAVPEPADVDAANDRWRRFVAAIWMALSREAVRLKKRARAQRKGS